MLIQGLRVFDQVLALTGGGPAGATQTLATEVYQQTFVFGNFGFGAALALVLSVLILVFTVVQQYATRDRLYDRTDPCSATRRRRWSWRSSRSSRAIALLMPFYFLVTTVAEDAASRCSPRPPCRSRRSPTFENFVDPALAVQRCFGEHRQRAC